jgi:hypothetical protein
MMPENYKIQVLDVLTTLSPINNMLPLGSDYLISSGF